AIAFLPGYVTWSPAERASASTAADAVEPRHGDAIESFQGLEPLVGRPIGEHDVEGEQEGPRVLARDEGRDLADGAPHGGPIAPPSTRAVKGAAPSLTQEAMGP